MIMALHSGKAKVHWRRSKASLSTSNQDQPTRPQWRSRPPFLWTQLCRPAGTRWRRCLAQPLGLRSR